ncbi:MULTISPECIES: hypothetical protein [unclassified Cupriavidus]|uniref:hypothetical protein n=1 Tax=unclassified Cupriavidus TaxID=2640874 RepID=UPI00313AD41B
MNGNKLDVGNSETMSTNLTPAEKAAIQALAAGDKAHLELAQVAYDRAVREHGVECCVEVSIHVGSSCAVAGLAAAGQVSCDHSGVTPI